MLRASNCALPLPRGRAGGTLRRRRARARRRAPGPRPRPPRPRPQGEARADPGEEVAPGGASRAAGSRWGSSAAVPEVGGSAVGGRSLHRVRAVGAEGRRGVVVAHDEEDVGPLGLGLGGMSEIRKSKGTHTGER